MGVTVPAVRTRRTSLRHIAILAIPALLTTTLAIVSSTRIAQAGGGLEAVTVQVLGGPIGNITTSPLGLSPAFAQTTTDYVLRCHSGINTIQLTLSAASAGKIAVGKNRGSSITIEENLVENQALIISGSGHNDSSGSSSQGQTEQGASPQAWGQAQYWIRCLPRDFPPLTVSRPGNPPPGWYLTSNLLSTGSGGYAMVLDNNGTPVWYRKAFGPSGLLRPVDVTPLPDGSIAWWSNNTFEHYNLRTEATRFVSSPDQPTDLHEFLPLPGGSAMILAYPLKLHVDMSALGLSSNSTLIDCVVEELDRNGQVVWQWRASDHISVEETQHPFANGDIFHCNSIDADQTAGTILVSFRNTDSVYLIDKVSGAIIWKMGGNAVSHDHAKILTMVGDPQGTFHAQHDARFQPGGDISLYDDQSWDPRFAARGVEYQIDQAAGTATLVWSYKSPDGLNSGATGSFRRLYAGTDNVIGWGVKPNTLFTEVDAGGHPLLDVRFSNSEISYRVIKVPSTALDHDLLRASAGLPAFDSSLALG
jgi:Arylsulfotransferase (ASST)